MAIRVFLVDEQELVLEGLLSLFQSCGDIGLIGHAFDALDALPQITSVAPDVVIVDIAASGSGGLALVRQITERQPTSRVLILSALTDSRGLYQSLKAGARGYVLKGADCAEIVQAIRTVHEGYPYISPRLLEGVIRGFLIGYEKAGGEDILRELSPRERDIFFLAVNGRSNAEMAQVLSLSPKTIEVYRSSMMRKLHVRDLPALVKLGIQHGLIAVDEPAL
jgi:DNA-binding NarL/FixJ family response regulator